MGKKHNKPQNEEKVKQNQNQTAENQENEVDIENLLKENKELKQKLDEALRAYAKCENDKKILKKEKNFKKNN